MFYKCCLSLFLYSELCQTIVEFCSFVLHYSRDYCTKFEFFEGSVFDYFKAKGKLFSFRERNIKEENKELCKSFKMKLKPILQF